jgi:hypothetical protein
VLITVDKPLERFCEGSLPSHQCGYVVAMLEEDLSEAVLPHDYNPIIAQFASTQAENPRSAQEAQANRVCGKSPRLNLHLKHSK